jgi:hypothetical protein
MSEPNAPQLYCPAGLAARTSRRTAALAVAAVVGVLAAIALAGPWGLQGAVIAFAATWGAWMVLMPVAVIASAVRR